MESSSGVKLNLIEIGRQRAAVAPAILILTKRRLAAGFGRKKSEEEQLQKQRRNASVRLA